LERGEGFFGALANIGAKADNGWKSRGNWVGERKEKKKTNEKNLRFDGGKEITGSLQAAMALKGREHPSEKGEKSSGNLNFTHKGENETELPYSSRRFWSRTNR